VYKTEFPLGKSIEHSLGIIYVQSLSSMLPALILNPKKGEVVLDMCAAPGSKTTLLCELMENEGFVFANDISLERLKILIGNCDRMGVVNCAFSHGDSQNFFPALEEKFDKILLDPPCTALGPEVSKKKQENNIQRLDALTSTQKKLLSSCIKMLKVQGEMVYSTCTTTLEENEHMLASFIKQYPVEIMDIVDTSQFEKNGGSLGLENTLRIDGKKIESESFFIAKLKKTAPCHSGQNFFKKKQEKWHWVNHDSPKVKKILQFLQNNYKIPEDVWQKFLFCAEEKNLHCIAQNRFDFSLHAFYKAGMELAFFDPKIGWCLTSEACQTLQPCLKNNALELSKAELISYYQGQPFKTKQADADHLVVHYKGYTWGAAKIRNQILFSQFPKHKRSAEIAWDALP
jgi:16S rRNA (cytosine1407-C5)-methyltransferase